MISEDPSYIVGGLVLVGIGCLVALRVSGQGKHLIFGLAAFAGALFFVAVDYLWVTDNERVEAVVERLRRAVVNSNVEGVFAELTADARFANFTPASTRAIIAGELPRTHFEYVRFSQSKTSAGGQSRRGTVEFRAVAAGMANAEYAPSRFLIDGSDWSLGVEETSPGVWKINRITPVRLPGPIAFPLLYRGRTNENRDSPPTERRQFKWFNSNDTRRRPRPYAGPKSKFAAPKSETPDSEDNMPESSAKRDR